FAPDLRFKNFGQHRNIFADPAAGKSPLLSSHDKSVCGAVGGEHDAALIDCEDSRRAAVNQEGQLFLGLLAKSLLPLYVFEVLCVEFMFPNELSHEQAREEIRSGRE